MRDRVRRTPLIPRGSELLTRRDPRISLVFVATEDTYAAKQYLDALQERGLVDRSRVEIIALPTTDNRSSLDALLDRLKAHQEALDVRLPQDECWAVFDVDHHQPKELSRAAQIARACERRLHETLQAGDPRARGYDKTKIGAERFAVLDRVQAALARARARSPATRERWPRSVGTHVYALVDGLPKPSAPLG